MKKTETELLWNVYGTCLGYIIFVLMLSWAFQAVWNLLLVPIFELPYMVYWLSVACVFVFSFIINKFRGK